MAESAGKLQQHKRRKVYIPTQPSKILRNLYNFKLKCTDCYMIYTQAQNFYRENRLRHNLSTKVQTLGASTSYTCVVLLLDGLGIDILRVSCMRN